jgi:hypothetical protein
MPRGSALFSPPAAEKADGVELAATVLLALATVATAWSGYQASRWNGEQAKAFSRANAARIESTRASSLANSQAQIDVATFIQWVDAYAQEETELADFYFERFREEFRPAVDAWIATRPPDVQRATNYVLAVVLFAASLFFRRDERQAANEAPARCPALVRARLVRRHRRVARDVPGQPLRLGTA